MSNPEENRINTEDELNELSDGDYVWSDEEGQLLDIVLALPALRITEPRNVEETPKGESGLKGKAICESSVTPKGKTVAKAHGVKPDSVQSAGSGSVAIGSTGGVLIAKTPRKKGSSKLTNPPEGPPVCNVCGKGFASWKAVFGHLRAHKNRGYVGFLPPPTFNPAEEGFGGVVAAASSGGGTSGYGTGGLDVDLNVDITEEEEEAPGWGSGSAPRLDLNMPPPREEGNAE